MDMCPYPADRETTGSSKLQYELNASAIECISDMTIALQEEIVDTPDSEFDISDKIFEVSPTQYSPSFEKSGKQREELFQQALNGINLPDLSYDIDYEQWSEGSTSSFCYENNRLAASALSRTVQDWRNAYGFPITDLGIERRNLLTVRRDHFPSRTLPWGISSISLPMSTRLDDTKALLQTTVNALLTIESAYDHEAVQNVLTKYHDIDVRIARRQDGEASRRNAPIQMFGEAIVTSAQLVSLCLADSSIELEDGLHKMSSSNIFEYFSKDTPLGIVGPLAMNGIVFKNGLLKLGKAGGVSIISPLKEAMHQYTRRQQQHYGELSNDIASLNPSKKTMTRSQEEHEAELEYIRMRTKKASPTVGLGCTALMCVTQKNVNPFAVISDLLMH